MTDVLARLNEALSDRYRVKRELGSGGMATVYLAEDLRHRRQVAIKVLRPEIAASLGVERFLREIQIAANLTHPHILPLFDSGAADGFLYYVMPFVEGESLRDRMNREGQFPIDDALRVTREVAAALSYAHGQDVVHRDIKPENVLLLAGEAVVADFGIARAVSAAGGERLTETGLAVGTPAYMSPEQASGEHKLDGRSDIYALGCVLYEMLSGEAPYTAPMPQALMAKKLAEPTPRISVVREAVQAVVEAALTKALAKTPADRFATAQQFAEALSASSEGTTAPEGAAGVSAEPSGRRPAWHWVSGLAAVVAIAVVGVVLFWGSRSGADSAGGAEIDRLVVAPFENRTGDSTAADWAFIAAEFITRAIDRAGVVTVVGARTVRDLVSEVDPAVGMPLDEIARRTGARYALAGSYSTSAGRVRFDVELVDVASGELLRALDPVVGAVDSLEAVFALLAERITAGTAVMLNPDLSGGFAGWGASPPSLEVLRRLTTTQDLFCRLRFQDAISEAQPALEEAPDYAPLLLMVAFSLENVGRLAEEDSVLRLVESRSEQLTTEERLLAEWERVRLFDKDRDRATRYVEELYRIQPSTWGYHAGLTALADNRLDDALERFLATDRDSPCYRHWFPLWIFTAFAYHLLGRYEEELEVARDGLRRFANANVRPLIFSTAVALGGLGRMDAVDSVLDVIADVLPRPPYSPGMQMAWIAVEFRAMDLRSAYEAVMDRALDWFAAWPANDLRFHRARTFYYAERWAEADSLFAAVIADPGGDAEYRGADGEPAALASRGYRGVALAHLGRREEALEIARWLEQLTDYGYVPTRWRAAIFAALGERERAVRLLRQAYDQGMGLGYYHHRDPEWEPLRDYRPYQEFVRPK